MQPIVQLYREARRRKVFRTAALYVLGSWAILQVADVLFPGFGIPETAIQALVWTAVLGFPVALTFGWMFDVGPDGIRRTLPRGAGEAAEPQPLGRRDYALIAAFLVVAAVLVGRAVQQIRQAAPAPAPAAAVAGSNGPEVARLPNSVAVLPFQNISSDPENEYFCDGISEEILNQIATVRTLNAIGRTSSFAFKGSKAGIEEISATLGVRYILQGSVRKADRRLRISAQLLDERGRQLWSETFDRELTNVFDIQQEIAQAVVARVAQEVQPQTGEARHPNLEAYDRYLEGRDLLHRRDNMGALAALQRAIELDPDFADAHAEWAIARVIGPVSKRELELADAAIDRALALNPKLLRAQAARGLWFLQSTPPDPAAAEATLRAVLQQEPNMSDALAWLSNALLELGRPDESLEILKRGARIDPLHPSIVGNLALGMIERGDDEAGLQLLNRQLQQPNPGYPIYSTLRDFYVTRGRLVDLNALGKDISLRNVDTHFSLAMSYALLGNFAAMDHWVERTLDEYPHWVGRPYIRVVGAHWRGDPKRALQLLDEGLKSAGLDIADQSEVFQTWRGALLARSGQHAAAIKVLEPLAGGTDTSKSMVFEVAPELDGWHALVWSYQHTGQEAKATVILEGLLGRCRQQLDDPIHPAPSDRLHHCAETSLLAGDTDRALALLERAIKAGWRNYYWRRADPYWAALDSNPRYRALMSTVKADVDRQRAEVDRIDASDGFEAKLDAAVAARGGAGK